MTSLHYTLIAAGAGLVAAMFLYNAFQEHRSRKQAERLFGLDRNAGRKEPGEQADKPRAVVRPEERIEPRIGLGDEDEILIEAPAEHEQEPLPEPAAARVEALERFEAIQPEPEPAKPAVESTTHVPHMEPESPLDAAIEYVARLRYAQPVTLSFATLLDNLRRISKPIRLLGKRDDGVWEPVLGHVGKPYDTVELALLFADRSGPVSEVQIETFCRRLYEFASEHGGAVSCQDKAEALDRARILDTFCAEVDMLIGLNVIPAQSKVFPLQDVHDLAERGGLTRGADGSYYLRDGEGRTLFNLAIQNELLTPSEAALHGCQGVSLLFDVPRVEHGIEVFDHMAKLGFELANRLGGQLVDDGGRPVSRESLAKDRRRLESLYARMAQHGIPAGGERAQRLFA